MPICALCLSIPQNSDSLKRFPTWNNATSWRYIHEFWAYDNAGSGPSLEESEESAGSEIHGGFPYHPDLDSLKASATNCDLCRLILSSIEKCIEELQNPDPDVAVRGLPSEPTWKLWLTRRNGLGDGFCVFTNCEDSTKFCLVGAVGFCVKEDDPLRDLFAGRPIEQSPDTPRSLARVVQWVDKCNAEHPDCTTSPPSLPARVIDVGDESSGYCVKLCEMNCGESGNYITLSHCWGTVTQFTTTKASIRAHTNKIMYDELPKSFRDAIAITRLLGVRYIWIDSICICQDDGKDWERESANMTNIYMNSYLTLAASAARDSSIGCFLPRNPTRYAEIPFTTQGGISGNIQAFILPVRKEYYPNLYISMADHIEMPDHPLLTRAWAVQERYLPRRTLHFGKHQMYFECGKTFRGENGLNVSWRYDSVHSHPDKGRNGEVLGNKGKLPLSQWQSLLWDYGTRKLTRPSDKLPAISGIARLFAESLDDEYVAGLWSKSLIEGLYWQGLSVHRVPTYRAPSWSWASVDGIPASGSFDRCAQWEPVAEILEYKVDLKGKNIFGEVTNGWIKLKAPLLPLTLDPRIDPENDGIHYSVNPKIWTEDWKGEPGGTYSRFDFDFTGPDRREDAHAMVKSLEGVPIFALILASMKWDESDETVFYPSLIVRYAEGDNSAMQRLGFVDFDNNELGECIQLEHAEERHVIKLV